MIKIENQEQDEIVWESKVSKTEEERRHYIEWWNSFLKKNFILSVHWQWIGDLIFVCICLCVCVCACVCMKTLKSFCFETLRISKLNTHVLLSKVDQNNFRDQHLRDCMIDALMHKRKDIWAEGEQHEWWMNEGWFVSAQRWRGWLTVMGRSKKSLVSNYPSISLHV